MCVCHMFVTDYPGVCCVYTPRICQFYSFSCLHNSNDNPEQEPIGTGFIKTKQHTTTNNINNNTKHLNHYSRNNNRNNIINRNSINNKDNHSRYDSLAITVGPAQLTSSHPSQRWSNIPAASTSRSNPPKRPHCCC